MTYTEQLKEALAQHQQMVESSYSVRESILSYDLIRALEALARVESVTQQWKFSREAVLKALEGQ